MDQKESYKIKAEIKTVIQDKELSFPYSRYSSYLIKVSTKYNNWTIAKRYKNFEELHIILSTRLSDLPSLPRKYIFNFEESVIKERTKLFSDFLSFLISNEEAMAMPEVLEFLKMDKDLFFLLTGSEKEASRTPKSKLIDLVMNFSPLTQDSRRTVFKTDTVRFKPSKSSDPTQKVDELLSDLNNHEMFDSLLINDFVDYLKKEESFPLFRNIDIVRLLQGTTKEKGLLYYAGNIKENMTGASAGVKLLCNLVSCEFNPEWEQFLSVIKASKVLDLINLNLSEHLINSSSEMNYLLYKFIRNIVMPHRGLTIKALLSDTKAVEIFELWEELYR